MKARGAVSSPEPEPAIDAGLPWWVGPSFLVLALALFATAIDGEYVLDGVAMVRDNPLFARFEPAKLAMLDWWAGTGKPGGLYRPVSLIWLAALRGSGVGAPTAINAANIVLHALVAWLHCALLRRFLGPGARALAIAWFASAFALVHPLCVEVVSGQVGVADLLAAAFSTAAVLVARERSLLRAVAGAALALLAVLSKESGVVVVPLAVLFQGLSAAEPETRLRRSLHALAWSSAGVALAFVLRHAAIGSFATVDDPVFAGFSTGARLASACAAFAAYSLPLFVAPWRQMAVVSFQDIAPASSFADVRALAGIALVIVLAAAPLLALKRGRRELAFGAWLFLASWLPTSNLFVSSGALAASRFLYAGLVGLMLLVASVIVDAWARGGVARIFAALFAAWFGLLLPFVTVRELGAWQNERTMLEAEVARAPSSIYSVVDLATLLRPNDPARAAQLFHAACESALPNVPGTQFPPEDLLEAVFVARMGAAQLAQQRGDSETLRRELHAAQELTARALEAQKLLPYREDWSKHQAYVQQQLGALDPARK